MRLKESSKREIKGTPRVYQRCFKMSFLAIACMTFLLSPTMMAPAAAGSDDLFDNQIRSLTEPKEPLTPSNDPRYQDNKDGTVTDLKHGLMWKKEDSYQELKKWMNWEMAQGYIEDLNEKRFAGYDDWQLPTREELTTLYEEEKVIPWNYYWTENQVHMDPIFGYTSCCFWTSELYKDKYAWTFNFIRGKSVPSPKGGPGLSLSVIRLVRKIEPLIKSTQKN